MFVVDVQDSWEPEATVDHMQVVATTSNCGLEHFAECHHPNFIVRCLLIVSGEKSKVLLVGHQSG